MINLYFNPVLAILAALWKKILLLEYLLQSCFSNLLLQGICHSLHYFLKFLLPTHSFLLITGSSKGLLPNGNSDKVPRKLNDICYLSELSSASRMQLSSDSISVARILGPKSQLTGAEKYCCNGTSDPGWFLPHFLVVLPEYVLSQHQLWWAYYFVVVVAQVFLWSYLKDH